MLPPMVRRLGEAAGVDAGGLLGPFRIAALSALFVQVGHVWLADDSPDLSATMKALDTALARAESLANFRPSLPKGLPAVPGSSVGQLPE